MREIISVCIGAFIVLVSTGLNNAYINRNFRLKQQTDEKMKEIDILLLLNKKINEILLKRDVDMVISEYISFDSFDDCYITIDDYVYLQSFCSQNHFYLPSYIVEEFFKGIAHRKIVLAPDEIKKMGAYTFKGGRIVLETFSEELLKCAEDRKIELKRMRTSKISYFHG